MKFNNVYLIFSLFLIPIYIFHAPVISYIQNFSKITYSLDIPENNIGVNSPKIINYGDLEISNDKKVLLFFGMIKKDLIHKIFFSS